MLANILLIQNITLRNLSSSGEFIFPYFNKLLELTYDPEVLRNLVSLATNIFTRLESNTQISNELAGPMLFYKPFAELSSRFQGDHQLLANTIKEALQDQSKLDRVPKSLENLLLMIFDDKETILRIVKGHIKKGMKNRTLFISELSKAIHKECKVIKRTQKQKYYAILGKVTLTAFIIDGLDDKVFSIMLASECLTSIHTSLLFFLSI